MGPTGSLILIFFTQSQLTFANDTSKLCSSSACIEEGTYNKMDLPPTKMEKPVEVNFTLQLMDIFDIDPESYTLHMNMVFRYKWIDNRITLEKDIEAVDKNFLEHLWTPHIYLYDSCYDSKTSPDDSGAQIEKCGTDICINFLEEVFIDFTCWMDFSKFPFNTNVCIFKVGPFSNYHDKVTFNTRKSSLPDEYLDKKRIRHYAIHLEYLEGDDTLQAAWGTPGNF